LKKFLYQLSTLEFSLETLTIIGAHDYALPMKYFLSAPSINLSHLEVKDTEETLSVEVVKDFLQLSQYTLKSIRISQNKYQRGRGLAFLFDSQSAQMVSLENVELIGPNLATIRALTNKHLGQCHSSLRGCFTLKVPPQNILDLDISLVDAIEVTQWEVIQISIDPESESNYSKFVFAARQAIANACRVAQRRGIKLDITVGKIIIYDDESDDE
jgi:hypothetical protein